MGLGAAFVMPATLSIITNVFPPQERSKAIAVWAGIAAGGAALGPIASGFLLKHFSWGSVFYVNVPIVIGALVVGWFILPTSRDPEESKLDPPGALLSIVGLAALVYAIIEAPSRGWASAETLLWFAAAIVLLAAFLWWELKSRHPMLNLSLFNDKRFSVASGGMTLIYFAMFGIFFLLTQYFQLVLGYDALKAGIAQLPFAIVLMTIAPQGPRLAARIGAEPHHLPRDGAGRAGAAVLLPGQVGHALPVVLIIPMVVMSAGMALSTPSLTGSIMSAVPLGKAGVGSAMNDTTRELGGALGVAVLGSLVASRYDSQIADVLSGLSGAAHAKANESLAGALQVAQASGERGAVIAQGAKDAYVSGMNIATLVAAVVAAIGSVIVYRMLPATRVAPSRLPAAPAEPASASASVAEPRPAVEID